jgi:collagen type III alpha
MATVQEPRAGNRFETFVEAELGRARRRIQAQDIGTAALGLLAGTLAYALGMVLLDRWLDLSDTARQVSLFAYLTAAVGYAAIVLTRPLRREVNPYFAARRVERAVPGAKNSVVSWLDLHAKPLPDSIKAAVSQKAAADIKKADVDEVVRDGRLPWIGGLAGGLFVAALILFFLLRPNQFLSLLSRAFTPFGSAAIASQTSLNLVQPAGGHLTVPVNSLVDFKVDVLGRVPDPAAPDAVRLRFRYNPTDPVWEEIRLDPSPREPREFALRMPAGRVHNGFVYQILGGDAATLEYRVQVRSSPLIEGFEVGYHFRPYLRFRDQTATNPNIEALRGTEVTLTARTNRTVKRGELTFQGRDAQKVLPPIPAEAVADQPASMRFRFVLDEDAKYTIRFWTTDGEDNGEPIPYTIKVLADHAPQVEVTQPAPETLPVNGTIAVEGKAADDFGITKMRLGLRLPDADRPIELESKPYRPGKVFKFADDTYPRALDYKDFLPLDQLKTTLGAPVTLKPGLVIEYWLEADDNCDHPKPNVGKSRVYKVTLGDPQEAQDKKAGEEQAAGDKAQHDQKQDQDLNQQNEEKKQAGKKADHGDANAEQPGDQPKQGDSQNPGEGNPQPDPNEQAIDKQAEKIREKMDRAREQGNKGEAKGAPDQQPGQPQTDPGQPKGDGNQGNEPNPQANPAGQPNDKKGEGKGDKQSGQPQPNGDKGENKPDNQQDPGAAKPMQPDNQGSNPNPGDQRNPNGKPSDSKQPDQKQPNPNGGAQPPKPNDGGQPDAKPPEQKQPNPNGGGAQQSKPNDAGNSGQPDNMQPPKGGEQASKPKGQPNPGDAKPQPQGGSPDAGEKKEKPQGDAQPGAAKANDPANSQKSGTEKPGEPKTGGPSGDNSKENKPDQPNGTPPNQPPNAPNDTKPTTGDRTPSDDKKKEPDGANGQQKQQSGAGAQPGDKKQPGEQPGTGPKQNPNNSEPKGQPDPKDPGKDGTGSNTGSGQGGAPDPGEAKPKNTPAAGQEKGEAKPAGDPGDKNQGQPAGKPTGEGDLTDAPKGGHDQPGAASKTQPKTDGAASDGPPSGNKANDQPNGKSELEKLAQDLKSGDPQMRQAAENRVKEMAKEMAKQGNGQKSADPKDVQAAEAKAKDMLKQLDKDPAGRQALENALKNAVQEAGKEELQKLTQDLKSGDAKTREAAKERAKQLAQSDLKPLADDAKSNDPQRQKRANDTAEKIEPDPQARQALLDALKGDGKPSEQPDKKPDGQAKQEFNGGQPDKVPQASPPEPGTAPDARFAKTTSDLQLERFPKNPSKDLLKDLGMTEEQYRQFLKAAAELQKKRQAEAAKNPVRGGANGTSGANSDVKRVQGGGDKASQLERGGASLPPEEYRDGYKGFTEDVSKSAGGGKKE